MNSERLLELYDRVSEAPDAISRLRRFILDLAVRGKLVEQDLTGELASELLKEIQAEKASLIQSGEIKRTRSSSVSNLSCPFSLPKSWVWTTLGEITSYIQRGKSPKYAQENGLPVVSQKCVKWTGLDLSVAKRITEESIATYEKFRFLRSGDLLWNSTGTGTIGRVIRLLDPPVRLVCDSHVTVVRCLLVEPEYVRTWLRTDHVYGAIEGRASGSTNQVELTAQMAVNQVVPLPPLTEQARIVAKVDELMALLDRLEAERAQREAIRDQLTTASFSRLTASGTDAEDFKAHADFAIKVLPELTTRPDQIKLLRQTILDLAVRGKLVEQDPNDEPASVSLKCIEAERQCLIDKKVIRRERALPSVDSEETPFELPQSWRWVRVGEVALFTQYGTSRKAQSTADGVPVLTMRNIQDGAIGFGGEKQIPKGSGELPELYLKHGDLLYNRTNSADLVGKTGIYLGEDDSRTFASYLIRICFSPNNSLSRYVNLAMNAPFFRATQIVPLIKQQTGQANVNGTFLKNMLVPLPPLREQYRIVDAVDGLMSLCDRLSERLVSGRDIQSRLLETLFVEALEPIIREAA